MKKGFLLFSALFLIAASGVFAAVSVKQEGDVVKVTWTYTAPDASFVGLVGDFQGWNLGGATPMTKDANGVWSITLDSTPTGEFTYKFNVDDEWTEDPQAPAGVDDGFGGTNGKVYVADLLAAASGAPVAAASGGGRIAFGNYTEASLSAIFLTQDVKTKEEKGFDLDAVNLALKSYWKISGPALPYVDFFMEIAVVDEGKIELFKSNTDGTDIPFTTWGDGLEDLTSILFQPLYAFQGKDSALGHFKATLKTPFVNIFTAQKYAKGTIRDETYLFTYIQEADSGKGVVELTSPEAIDLGGGMSLSYLLGPNRLKDTYGLYSYAEVKADAFDVALQLNGITNQSESLFKYWDNTTHLVGLSARLKGLTGISVVLDSFLNIYGGDAHADKEIIDGLAAQVNVGYTSDMFGATVKAGYFGDNVDTIFGNGDNINKGKLFLALNPYFTTSGIKVGFDSDVKLDNMTSENSTAPAIETYIKPYIDYTADFGTVSLYSKLNYNQIAESDDADQPWAFKFAEVAAKFTMPGLTAYAAMTNNLGSWNADDAAYKAEGSDISALASYTLVKDMNLYLGGIYRTQGADETADAYLLENPVGFTLGYDFLLPLPDLKLPKLFAVFNYNFDPYDGGKPGFLMTDYRAEKLGEGSGLSTLRTGIVWSF